MASNDQDVQITCVSDKYQEARHRMVIIWSWVGGIILAGVGLYVANILSIAIGIVIWTVVFVCILSSPVSFLERHGVKRVWGTLIAFVLMILVLLLLLVLMFSPAFGIEAQFGQLAKNLPGYFKDFSDWLNSVYQANPELFQNDTVRNWLEELNSSFSDWIKQFATTSASGILAVGTSMVNVLICVGFALVVSFWMLIELPNLGREVSRLIGPKYSEDAQMLHLTATRVVGGYLRTTVIQCAIIGVLCGVMFAILGVPSPAALGVITGLLNIIPIIGPWLGGGIAFVASFLESPLVGIIALVGVIVIQQLIYTFVSPKLMGDSVDIHPALTFIALMAGSGIGAAMGGMMGALIGTLLSIPLVAMFKSMFVYYFEKNTGRRIVSPDGVFFKGTPEPNTKVDPMADATGASNSGEDAVSSGASRLIKGLEHKKPPEK